MPTISVTELLLTFSRVLDLVGAGAEVTITRHGRPVAVIGRVAHPVGEIRAGERAQPAGG